MDNKVELINPIPKDKMVYYRKYLFKEYYPVICKCGWRGMSNECLSPTGEECECPCCYKECDEDYNAMSIEDLETERDRFKEALNVFIITQLKRNK